MADGVGGVGGVGGVPLTASHGTQLVMYFNYKSQMCGQYYVDLLLK